MKHKAPQYELPGTEEVFNLRGEQLREELPVVPGPNDDKQEGFTFDGEASYSNHES